MTTKESGTVITVGHCKECKYQSIADALESISEHNSEWVTIYVKNGVYNEKLMLTKPFVSIVGESRKNTILTYDDYAKKTFDDGTIYRTFNTYTVFVGADDIRLHNLTIQNTAGIGEKVGQAVALYVEGSRVKVEDVDLLANQDTLFTGPLPHKPVEGNDFGGPMEGKSRIVGNQYYKNCYIRGDIDFIFGSAVAVFESCELHSNDLNKEVNGYVTAASTYEGQEYGYVFMDCKFTSEAPAQTVYLGRPWRDYAKTVLIHCSMGEHICLEGWHDWNKAHAREVSYYAEYESYNLEGKLLDMTGRASWTHVLNEEDIKKYTLENILGKNRWYL